VGWAGTRASYCQLSHGLFEALAERGAAHLATRRVLPKRASFGLDIIPRPMTAYDVFLSHDGADKAAVEEIALRLLDEAGLRPFLDKWERCTGGPPSPPCTPRSPRLSCRGSARWRLSPVRSPP
jgi:hypothetical protein